MGSELKLGGPFRERDATGLPWHPAPETSHVESFRFYDQRRFKLLTRSEIHVRFKAQRRRDGSLRKATEYRYFISDPVMAASIFFELLGHDHPGMVIHAKLINGRVPYDQTV